jgi:hypothetical protein
MIDDPDDPRVDRWFGGVKRKARLLASDEKHILANACADAIHRDKRLPCRLTRGRQWLNEEQFDPGEILVFARDDDGSNHFTDLHVSR